MPAQNALPAPVRTTTCASDFSTSTKAGIAFAVLSLGLASHPVSDGLLRYKQIERAPDVAELVDLSFLKKIHAK